MSVLASIDWGALGKAALAALAGAGVVVLAYSVAVVTASRVATARRMGNTPAGAVVLTALAATACLAAVVLGIIVMMDKS